MAKEYRAAVIGRTGRGNYGHGLDTVWREIPNVTLVAVADDNKTGLAAAAKRLGVERAYSDYRKMLDEVKPDFVSIAPRWLDTHRDMVIAAAQRGIHIYMEKPMCRTLAEADQMVDACERTHVQLAIAHQTRYSPKLDVIRNMIDDGKIGTVLEYRGRGKEDRRGGGEDLWVLGSHVMNLIHHFGGKPLTCTAQVTQAGHSVGKADVHEGNEGIGPLAGDALQAMYTMPDGATAYFASHRGAAARPSRFGLMIYGSRGIIELQTGYLPSVKFLPDASWSPGRTGKAWQDVSSAGPEKPEPLKDVGLHGGNVAAAKDLIDAVENNRQPKCSIYDARITVEMIAAVFESHRAGGPVDIPLKNRNNPLSMLK